MSLGVVVGSSIENEIVPLAAMAVAVLMLIVLTIGFSCYAIARTAARERSRRELAAYVAEGSITPEDAERLLSAGGWTGPCGSRRPIV